MRRFALVALLGLGVAACSQNPTEPGPAVSLAKSRPAPTPTPATVCYAQQLAVASVTRRVEYLTSGEVRTALLAPLNLAYEALSPAACRPVDAIAHLEQFQAAVTANEASIWPSVVTYFMTATNSIIANLRTIV
jgi:hypothetical protein